jgi:CRP-like cAMP-binding protein
VHIQAHLDPKSLTRLKSLAWMSPNQAARLANDAIAMKVPRDGPIFQQGEASSKVYILLTGVAKLCYVNRDQRVLVGLVGPGEVFGLSSLLPPLPTPRIEDGSSEGVAASRRAT